MSWDQLLRHFSFLPLRLPVSNFARDLLTKFHDEPVFSVNPVQHPIYKKVGVMCQAKVYRVGPGLGGTDYSRTSE